MSPSASSLSLRTASTTSPESTVVFVQDVRQCRGDDVLRHRVELVGELAIAVRPGSREALVSTSTEQQGRRAHRLVDLELVALVTAVEVERPRPADEVVVAARRLHDSVERYELGDDDAAHGGLLSAIRCLYDGRNRANSSVSRRRWAARCWLEQGVDLADLLVDLPRAGPALREDGDVA